MDQRSKFEAGSNEEVQPHARRQQSKSAMKIVTKGFRHMDKKRLTASVVDQLVSRNMVDPKKVHVLDKEKEYSGRITMSQVVSPVSMIIKLENVNSPAPELMEALNEKLELAWKAESGFNMVSEFPGHQTHVVVAVKTESSSEDHLEEDGTGPGSNVLQDDPQGDFRRVRMDSERLVVLLEDVQEPLEFLPYEVDEVFSSQRVEDMLAKMRIDRSHGMTFHRGVIVGVSPGENIISATYQVFLYDEGRFQTCNVRNMTLLPEDCRVFSPPVYRILRFPGLRPVIMVEKIVNFFSGEKEMMRIPCTSWSSTALSFAKSLSSNENLRLNVLADHGVEILGDVMFVQEGSDEEISYVTYLEVNGFAERGVSYYDDLLCDAEDESLGDWKKDARTWC